jgi:hypothetical protein
MPEHRLTNFQGEENGVAITGQQTFEEEAIPLAPLVPEGIRYFPFFIFHILKN